jgi:hypothetical protein
MTRLSGDTLHGSHAARDSSGAAAYGGSDPDVRGAEEGHIRVGAGGRPLVRLAA